MHDYPQAGSPAARKRKLGEILVSMQLLSRSELDAALARRRRSERLGDFLVRNALVPEEKVYRALSLQQGLPFQQLTWENVQTEAFATIPTLLAARWQLIPFRVESDHSLWVASPEAPDQDIKALLSTHCALRTQFHLITASNYQQLQARVAPAMRAGASGTPHAHNQLKLRFMEWEQGENRRNGSGSATSQEEVEAPARTENGFRLRESSREGTGLLRLRQVRWRVRLPGWILFHRRLAVVVEYRRSL